MGLSNSMVFVIDDDAAVRKSLGRLLRSAEYQMEAFASASDFLARPSHPGPSCVVIDVQMPGLNGLAFQEMLIQRRRQEQLVFITGHGSIAMCAKAMKAGAVDFLPKPIKSAELLKCVDRALQRSTEERARAAVKADARRLLDLLTPREFEVMQTLLTGMLNKQVGAELGMAEKTVKLHRGRIMHKIGVFSVAELVRVAANAGVNPPKKGTSIAVPSRG